jgi:hypothetical protein
VQQEQGLTAAAKPEGSVAAPAKQKPKQTSTSEAAPAATTLQEHRLQQQENIRRKYRSSSCNRNCKDL